MRTRTRRLALTNEGAGHPFRRSLPPAESAHKAADRRGDNDWKLFALSFAAFFTCFYVLIA